MEMRMSGKSCTRNPTNAETSPSGLNSRTLLSIDSKLWQKKVACDKLAKRKQLKDVATFNDDFENIILDIPNSSIEQKIDHYIPGLYSYIWKELCTNDCKNNFDAIRDAERVESAQRQLKPSSYSKSSSYSKARSGGADSKAPSSEPMDNGNVTIGEGTPEERENAWKKAFAFADALKDIERRSAWKAGGTEYYYIYRQQTHTIR